MALGRGGKFVLWGSIMGKLKLAALSVYSRSNAVVLGAVGYGVVAANQAYAAVPEAAEDIFTTAATDFGTIIGYGFVAMAAVVGGMIVFDLVRKIAKKSTK